MSHRRSRSASPGRYSRSCSSNDPRDLERRIFVGNLPTSDMEKKELEDLFSPYGKIVGVSMFRGFGFVQFERVEEAEAAKAAQKGRIYKGYKIDVNMAVERRQAKPQSQQSPPRRAPYSSYGDSKEPRPRSRSPVYGRDGRDGREPRNGRDGREPRDSCDERGSSREPRSGGHSRDPDYRYRSSESRDKDLRGDPRDPAYSRDDYDRYYRSGAEDYYRRKDEPYRDPYRDPWNGRREPEDGRARPEERRRNELYRQYYEELQRRYDTDRPVDCSVIVVNKAQKEYAETVGRKVRDLGMVVDLIFLNTEVSLTQALEDVGRARTPFAIIITQQHQVHRSCTVNILFGTPQEHRNMPMQDAMMLVAHNYDTYKVENREKEREEIARKAAKMADDVLVREPDRESHPVSVLTAITLLSENRFITPEELDSLIGYLKEKRTRLLRSTVDPLAAAVHVAAPAAVHHDIPPSAAGLPPPSHSTHTAPQSSHLGPAVTSSASVNPSHQQELQAKILSLFNSGTGTSAGAGGPSVPSQSQAYGSLGPSPSQNPPRLAMPGPPPAGSQGYGTPPGRMPLAPSGQRPLSTTSGINFDSPSVQKALDTLIQSGPSLTTLVGAAASQQPPPRPQPGMGQVPPMSMYPRQSFFFLRTNFFTHLRRTKNETSKLWDRDMSHRRSRSASPGRHSRSCSSNDPRDLERRIFVGNLPTSDMEKKELEDLFSPYGKIVGVSMFRGFGFVQFERVEEAEAAKAAQKGRIYKGYKIDVNMAVERRQAKPQSQQSPPRRAPYSSYGDSKEPRPRSRSPVYGRDGREPRDSRDGRGSSREPRSGGHSRDPDYRYRSSESRDKDLRGDPRDPAYSRDDYDRYYRSGAEDYYRRKDEPYRDPYRDPWNGRREPEDGRARPEERRRNELYRQYYEELQRRYDTDRPVDCSVIVVNKAQKEYAETVGRKVRDLGMVVDLIFLNTEVSLTQALEDVGRARTPFAIIITQQHQVHRSCTVNILFGTPQEHRNMPMQDAMMLVAHNYDTYKVENREKEREEIARKAAKMADDVLVREPDRESHPVSVLTAITLLSENRFVTPEELDSLIGYLTDKRARLLRSAADPLTAAVHVAAPAAVHHDIPPSAAGLPPPSHSTHMAPQSSHLGPAVTSSASVNPSHQQELQAKILSLFNSGTGTSAGAGGPSVPSQSQAYGSLGPSPSQNPPRLAMPGPPPAGSQGYGTPPGRMPLAPSGQRPLSTTSGINFDSPSVQKALDTLIQSGPSLTTLVGAAASQQPPPRPQPGMGQVPPMSMYPRHY
ncbi:nuclear receptor coactivator 5 [Chelmon rostratus]|uniref:nuclear receptor coactivator 5 n=1 Tax=Chelmon rostratus TaxID=109905 RepID=UPI001BE5D619|nr:nuclear receptor coactivator 5 [Chelmon rostratus]